MAIHENNWEKLRKLLIGSLAIICLMQVSATVSYGQLNSWAKSITAPVFSSAAPNVITLDAAGNVYVSGEMSGTIDFDPGVGVRNLVGSGAFIAKYNPSGNLIWAKHIATTVAIYSASIIVNSGQEVFVTGTFAGITDFDPGPGVYNMQNLYPTASAPSAGFVVKLDNTGNFEWAASFASNANTVGTGLALDASSNIIIAGYFGDTIDFDPGPGVAMAGTPSVAYNFDVFVLKLSTTGTFISNTVIVDQSSFYVNGMKLDANDNIVLTGTFIGQNVDFDPGPGVFNMSSYLTDVFVLKLNPAGNFLWAKCLTGNTTQESGTCITTDLQNNIYVGGYYLDTLDVDPGPGVFNLTTAGLRDIFILKLTANGDFTWAKKIGGVGTEAINSLVADQMGKVTFCGTFIGTVDFDPGPGVQNLVPISNGGGYICRLDSSGNYMHAEFIGNNSGGSAKAMTIDDLSNVYTVGFFSNLLTLNPVNPITIGTPPWNSFYIYKRNYCTGPISSFNITANGPTTFCLGDSVVLQAPVSLPDYQWYRNNRPIANETNYQITVHTAGRYKCFSVNNAVCPDTSNKITTELCIPIGPSQNRLAVTDDEPFVFPNPSNNKATIRSTSGLINIFDAQGKLVLSLQGNNNDQEIDLSDYPEGLYFIRVENNGSLRTEKLLLIK